MCKAIIEELRAQIVKSDKFPPDKKGKAGEEPFNVSAFVVAAFGEGADPKRWSRRAKRPEGLRMVEALAMASVVKKSLDKIITLAEERMESIKEHSKSPGDEDHEKPTGTHGE